MNEYHQGKILVSMLTSLNILNASLINSRSPDILYVGLIVTRQAAKQDYETSIIRIMRMNSMMHALFLLLKTNIFDCIGN